MKFKVYISGPMTGLPNDGRDAMIAEEAVIRKYFASHEVEIINPARIPDILMKHCENCVHCYCGKPLPSCIDSRATLLRDMLACRQCDVLWLMDGWQLSLGCCMDVLAWLESHLDWWDYTPADKPPLEFEIEMGVLISPKGFDTDMILTNMLDSLEAKPCT